MTTYDKLQQQHEIQTLENQTAYQNINIALIEKEEKIKAMQDKMYSTIINFSRRFFYALITVMLFMSLFKIFTFYK